MSTAQSTSTTVPREHSTPRLALLAAIAALVAVGLTVAIIALSSNASSSPPSSSAAPAGTITPAKLYPAGNTDRGNAAVARLGAQEQSAPEAQTAGQRP
jgi:hypothetical protein